MYYIQQTRKDDCGYASLKMLLASLNKDKNYLFLQEEKEKGSYSYLELVTIAKQHDVELNGYRIDSLKPSFLTVNKNGFLVKSLDCLSESMR